MSVECTIKGSVHLTNRENINLDVQNINPDVQNINLDIQNINFDIQNIKLIQTSRI